MIDSPFSVGMSPSAFRRARYLDEQGERLRAAKEAAKRAAIERAKEAARQRARDAAPRTPGGGNLAAELPAFEDVIADPAGSAGRVLRNPLAVAVLALAVVGAVLAVRHFTR